MLSAGDDSLSVEPSRHIRLEGATNLRDIGGYRAAHGRRVRWRRIFRADSLSHITPGDLAIIARLGIRTVYDLRCERERRDAPDRLPRGVTLHVCAQPLQHPKVVALSERIRRHIAAGELDARDIEPWICERYRLFATEELEEYRRYFRELLVPDRFPLLVHCASGKDRTGFAIAVTLLSLGVTRQTILEDYLLSNRYPRSLAARLPPNASLQVLTALSSVQSSYLLAAFAAIDAAWGGEESFLTRGLQLTAAERTTLQEALLEPLPEGDA